MDKFSSYERFIQGSLPNKWAACRVKNAFSIKQEKNKQDEPIVLALGRSGVRVRDISTNEGQLAESYNDYNVVDIGDFLLNIMDLYSGANCNVSKVNGVISPAYANLRFFKDTNPYYYDYFFKNQYWLMALFAYGKGVSFDNRWTISKTDLLRYYIPKPPLATQNRIVAYLDNQIAIIDKQIEANKKAIDLLGEYRASEIGEIIAKFANDKNKLKYLLASRLQYGANASGVIYEENLPRFVRITDIQEDGLTTEDKQSLTAEDAEGYILEDSDVLFARSGATVGKTFKYKKEYGLCAFAGYLIRAKFKNKSMAEYVYNFTKSSLYKSFVDENLIQATIQNLSAEKYKNAIIPLPCEKEIKIVDAEIDKKCKEIDQIIIYRKSIIEKLEEYKKSLIYECVTGKSEVV